MRKPRVYVYYLRFENRQDSHVLLRSALIKYLKEIDMDRPEKMSIVKGKAGKPYVRELPEVQFSISHSGIWWCCACGKEELGLDLQLCESGDKRRVAERFFHPQEKLWLKERAADEFYRIWAYKESYVKYTGTGLTKGLDYFSVISEEQELIGARDAVQQEIPFPDGQYYLVLTGKQEAEIVLGEMILHSFL